jgi:hypothetical protein
MDLSGNVPIPGTLTVAQNAAFNDGGHRRSMKREPKRIRERQFDHSSINRIYGSPNYGRAELDGPSDVQHARTPRVIANG